MKKLLLPVILFLCCLAYQSSSAQVKFHIGGISAVNTTYVLDKGLTENPFYDPQRTFHWSPYGVAIGLDISEHKGIQVEPLLANQGQRFDIVDKDGKKIGERNIDLQYLNLPLLFKSSRGDGKVRFTTMIGAQLSMLRNGLETYHYAAATIKLIEGGKPPDGATLNADGTYDVQAMPLTTIASSHPDSLIASFRDKDIQAILSAGLEFDISRYFYISTDIRGNYGFVDMRSGDLIDKLQNGTASVNDFFSKRANLLVGVQVGLHFMFGGVKSYAPKPGTPAK